MVPAVPTTQPLVTLTKSTSISPFVPAGVWLTQTVAPAGVGPMLTFTLLVVLE